MWSLLINRLLLVLLLLFLLLECRLLLLLPKALFGRTDYMSEICAHILEVLDALDHFKVRPGSGSGKGSGSGV